MVRELTEKEIQILDICYRLCKHKVVVRYEKYPQCKGIYKVYGIEDEIDGKHYRYSTFNIHELKGMFDGYFKGLNQVFGDTRR